ncbi:hypothetical protein DSECCO2_633370 [anaerobic digester metagenome]
MLHRGDLGLLGAKRRGQPRPDDASGLGNDHVPARLVTEGEHYTRIGRSRLEHHLNLLTAVQPYSGAPNFFFEGRLFHVQALSNFMPTTAAVQHVEIG